ncbi:MAG: response regulator [Maricaulaceae bacterium]
MRVLHIDDDDADLLLTAKLIAAEGGADVDVVPASGLGAALELLAEQPMDVILLDAKLPDAAGLEDAVARLRLACSTPIVVFTSTPDAVRAYHERAIWKRLSLLSKDRCHNELDGGAALLAALIEACER